MNTRSGAPNGRANEPIEVRDALRDTRVIALHVPREYPDLSLSWIIASDLLSAQIGDSQVIPSVVEAQDLHRPRVGIPQLVDPGALRLATTPEFTNVFVIDDFNFGSRSRCDFLREQIDAWPKAKFIIVTRNREDVYLQADFTKNVASSTAQLCDVSFMEISAFLQKNFEMPASASEVVAVRLRETFHRYALPAHPSYFADISRNTLNALLQANRRAELIEIAVVGYLSFVVAEDREPISLSRTTREKFLSDLVFFMSVEKKSFTEAQLTAEAETFAKKFDFGISPARFVSAFIEKRILHLENGLVRFTLPFMEAYLLAKRLTEDREQASKYFTLTSVDFDHGTFAIYAELGASDAIVADLLVKLDSAIATMTAESAAPPLLFDPSISVALLDHPDRLASVQKRLQKAEEDVRTERDQAKEKQTLLDASDQIRDMATRASAARPEGDTKSRIPDVPNDVEATWTVAVSLLGSGAERLHAETKRDLVQKVVRLAGLIADCWMRANRAVDFVRIKKVLLDKEELVASIAKSQTRAHIGEAKNILANIADFLEFLHMTQPFMGVTLYLCEEARDIVLAESIANTSVNAGIEELLQSLWLSDIDAERGKGRLVDTIKRIPRSKFLRNVVAIHLMQRVFWKHWRKQDRLALFDAADVSLKGVGQRQKTGELQRIIENLPDTEDLEV